ncbi:hypothetical protein [Aureimonas sp. D3]|uniref:hypothetical protein n=1 Tax=Aureimonas sp. D3 TaxID=1638164 RepID=UPI0012E38121|nr:hypothetical protein [Aureimonas sp. D3]
MGASTVAGRAAPPDRHHQGIGDELGRHGAVHDRQTTCVEKRSMMAVVSSRPLAVRMQVTSAFHIWFNLSAVNWRSSTLSEITERTPLSWGMIAALRSCRQSIQPLDPMQTEGKGSS